MCLAGCITAQAQGDFNPASPSEPGPPTIYSRIVLLKNIGDAGSVSGEGRYVVGNTVNVYAYVNSSYTFRNWTDTKGNVLTTSTSLSFVNTEQTDTLIANYAFTPSNPSEPSEPSTTLSPSWVESHAGMLGERRRSLSGGEDGVCECVR